MYLKLVKLDAFKQNICNYVYVTILIMRNESCHLILEWDQFPKVVVILLIQGFQEGFAWRAG